MKDRFESFKSFYEFYLLEHKRTGTRVLHFIGTVGAILGILTSIFFQSPKPLIGSIIMAYFFAWVSHFFIEHNKPATFKYPFYSFLGDLKMFSDLLLRKRGFSDDDPNKNIKKEK